MHQLKAYFLQRTQKSIEIRVRIQQYSNTDTTQYSQLVVPYVNKFIDFLKQTCNVQEVGLVEYIFGFRSNLALNHIFIEFKKEGFYNFDENIGVEAFCERIIHKIRKIIIKEKSCIKSNKMYDQFTKKWDNFIYIYDFRGPDLNIV